MRRFLRTVVLCGVYLTVLLGTGLLHRHADADLLGNHAVCQACLWQNSIVSDEPLSPACLIVAIGVPLPPPLFAFNISYSFLLRPSERAPPFV